MKKKRWLAAVLTIALFFSGVQFNAMNNNDSNSINSDEELDTNKATSSNAEYDESLITDEEDVTDGLDINKDTEDIDEKQKINLLSDDNEWDVYLSVTDDGKTSGDNIFWDASDGTYLEGSAKTIQMQITYRNTKSSKEYQPGELNVSIPNLAYGSKSAQWKVDIALGANSDTTKGKDWDLVGGGIPSVDTETFEFTNAKTIEAGPNFEGSIALTYIFTPLAETTYSSDRQIEFKEDTCTHEFNNSLHATFEGINTQEVSFEYIREYEHPWVEYPYVVKKTADKIDSMEGLTTNPDDYTWVKFGFSSTYTSQQYSYPYVFATNRRYHDVFPSECIVSDGKGNILSNDYYANANDKTHYVFVGYPKDKYIDNGVFYIDNTVDLYGTYYGKDEEKLADSSISLNLTEFSFAYDGDLYRMDKDVNTGSMSATGIRGNGSEAIWQLKPTARYSGYPMDLEIGDDILYTVDNNKTVKVPDEDYYFKKITFNGNSFLNGNGVKIDANKYECELYVSNGTGYTLKETFKNPASSKTWNFSESDNIDKFYILIKGVEETVWPGRNVENGLISATTVYKNKNISDDGYLHNFDYMRVYINGKVVNKMPISHYDNFITKEEIAKYDKDTYGYYIMRNTSRKPWGTGNGIPLVNSVMGTKKEQIGNYKEDADREVFEGTFEITQKVVTLAPFDRYPLQKYQDNGNFYGFVSYDLLPQGMKLNSTEAEIAATRTLKTSNATLLDKQENSISNEELEKITKTNIEVIENWRNTGRTMLIISTTFDKEFTVFSTTSRILAYDGVYYTYRYDYSVPYDSIYEFGSTYKNAIWTAPVPSPKQTTGLTIYWYDPESSSYSLHALGCSKKTDDGSVDEDMNDIDGDGRTGSYYWSESSVSIPVAVSTHQDVSKYVKSETQDWTNSVYAKPGSEYEYKLRVRNGQSRITNLVIYDSLEMAYGDNEYWQGKFKGVDTSYAEKQGYSVKVWYSIDEEPGELYLEDGTINPLYTESSNNAKAVAFEYLDKTGSPAILPTNSMTYVVLKMEAPSTATTGFAYNNCWTRWNAIDGGGNIVEGITGIDSKEVTVRTDNTTKITVTKRWNDSDNKYNTRPSNIDIILLENGEEIRRQTASESNDWTVTFFDLDIRNKYTIEEESVDFYKQESIVFENGKYIITNTVERENSRLLSGTKTWRNDMPSERPLFVTIRIFQNGNYFKTISCNGNDDWKWSISVPKYDANGNDYEYSLEEVPIDGYETMYSNGTEETASSKTPEFFDIINTGPEKEPEAVDIIFSKKLIGTQEEFDRMKLDKEENRIYKVIMTNKETKEQILVSVDLLENTVVKGIPFGTYTFEELGENWSKHKQFSLLSNNATLINKELTISSSDGNAVLIDIDNKINDERYYDAIYDAENLFTLANK